VDEKDLYPATPPDQPSWRKGDLDGMDAPIEEAWRKDSEDLVRLAGVQADLEIVGMTWSYAKLQVRARAKRQQDIVFICIYILTTFQKNSTRRFAPRPFPLSFCSCPPSHPPLKIVVPSKTSSEDQSCLVQEIHAVWEDSRTPSHCQDVLEKHEVTICTPGAPNVLSTQEQFDAYIGFEVSVQTVDPFKSNRVIEGKLVSRDALEVKVNKKGRMVSVPNEMVGEVKLPKPKTEKGDPFN